MKPFRFAVVLFAFFAVFLFAGCSSSGDVSEPSAASNINEQEVAVAVALTQTAVAVEEAPLPEPQVVEATPVPQEVAPTAEPVVEEPEMADTDTAVCPIPEITKNHYGEGVMDGQPSYRSEVNGFCVYYPVNFTIGDEIVDVAFENGKRGNVVGIYGPPLDESLDPVAASLNILITETESNDLSAIVDEYMAGTTYGARQDLDVSGIPAIMLQEVPGRTLSTQVFMVNNGRVYELSFYPVDPAFPQAQEDVGSLMNFVFQTWTFLE